MSGGSNFGTCTYADCPNSHSANSNSTFFKFPTDDARRKKWIANCGNPAVAELSDRQLRGKRLCALHFADSSFADSTKKENLTDKAIPIKHSKQSVEAIQLETPSKRRGRGPPTKVEKRDTEEDVSKSPEPKRASVRTAAKVPEKVDTPKNLKSVEKETKPVESTPSRRLSARNPVAVKPTENQEVEKSATITITDNATPRRVSSRTAAKVAEKVEPSKPVPERSPEPKSRKLSGRPAEDKDTSDKTEVVRVEPKPSKPSFDKSLTPEALPKKVAVKIPGKPEKSVPLIHPNVRSKFGKALYSFINELFSEEEPVCKKEKKVIKPAHFSPASDTRSLLRTVNGRLIKTENIEPLSYQKVMRGQKQVNLQSQLKTPTGMEQFVTLGNDSSNLIIQNGGNQFTLAEGQEYEVIGEADPTEEIEVMESENNEIEIIEVDDQTMAQLTAQNVFFPNSGNIQVSELDPNMGQILRVINPSESSFYPSQ